MLAFRSETWAEIFSQDVTADDLAQDHVSYRLRARSGEDDAIPVSGSVRLDEVG